VEIGGRVSGGQVPFGLGLRCGAQGQGAGGLYAPMVPA
jgi:hypothetical protein